MQILILFAVYKFNVGDEILIKVRNKNNLFYYTYSETILPSGEVNIKLPVTRFFMKGGSEIEAGKEFISVDLAKIAGYTKREADSILTYAFSKFLKDPVVDVALLSSKLKIVVSGAVNDTGKYPFIPGKTVLYYITQAGGLLPWAQDYAYIRKKGKDEEIKVDFSYVVERGDIIRIPEAYVYVRGAVESPVSVPYRPNFTAMDYINGVTLLPDADIKRSYVIKKNGKKISINKAKIDKGDIIVIGCKKTSSLQEWLKITGGIASTILAIIAIKSAVLK